MVVSADLANLTPGCAARAKWAFPALGGAGRPHSAMGLIPPDLPIRYAFRLLAMFRYTAAGCIRYSALKASRPKISDYYKRYKTIFYVGTNC